MFLLFDGRARSGDTDAAAILDSAKNADEARRQSVSWKGTDAIWFEYKRAGIVLHDGRMRSDIGQFLLKAERR